MKKKINFLKTPCRSNLIVYSDGCLLEFVCSKDTKNYTVQPVPGSLPTLTHPTAGAFVDIDGDLAAGMDMNIQLQLNLIK